MTRGDFAPERASAVPRDAAAVAAVHMNARFALSKVLTRCGQVGIAVLPVKGAVLAHKIYDYPWQRPIADIDLRLSPRDLPRMARLAADEGWLVTRRARAYGNLVFLCEGIPFDVESSVGPPGVCAVSTDALIRRATLVHGTFSVPHLEAELHDHALVLVVNVYKDHLAHATPHAKEDLLRIARAPGFNADVLVDRAREGRLTTSLFVLATYFASSYESEAWRQVAERVGAPRRPKYARAMARLLEGAGGSGGPRLRQSAYDQALRFASRAASDSAIERARAFSAMALWALEIWYTERPGREKKRWAVRAAAARGGGAAGFDC